MIEVAGIRAYTIPETAEILHVSTQSVYRLVETKKLEYRQLGNKYYISEKDLQRYVTGDKPTENDK